MKRAVNKIVAILFIISGTLMIAFALFSLERNIEETNKSNSSAEQSYQALRGELNEVTIINDSVTSKLDEIVDSTELTQNITDDNRFDPDKQMETINISGVNYIGVIEIPKLDISMSVINECTEQNLKISSARYTGSVYNNDMIIAGHNYKKHFGKLNNLVIGDIVSFVDIKGNVFEYEVAEIQTIDGKDINEMHAGDWDLTLFTCTNGGICRLAIRCVLTGIF